MLPLHFEKGVAFFDQVAERPDLDALVRNQSARAFKGASRIFGCKDLSFGGHVLTIRQCNREGRVGRKLTDQLKKTYPRRGPSGDDRQFPGGAS